MSGQPKRDRIGCHGPGAGLLDYRTFGKSFNAVLIACRTKLRMQEAFEKYDDNHDDGKTAYSSTISSPSWFRNNHAVIGHRSDIATRQLGLAPTNTAHTSIKFVKLRSRHFGSLSTDGAKSRVC